MLIRDDGPGYAFQLKMGATSLTEAWDTNSGSSQNHCMLGHIEEWFYRGLGGIACDPTGPGFEKTILKPQIVGNLASAKTAYLSPYGRIACAWSCRGDALSLSVTVPANTTATVYVPANDATVVTEGVQPAEQAEGIRFLRMEHGAAVFEVGSGQYHFISRR